MDFMNDFRTNLDTISATLQALTDMHRAGADRTTSGCQAMVRMAATLETTFCDLTDLITIIKHQ